MKTTCILCLFVSCPSFTTTEKQFHLKLKLLGGIDHGSTLCSPANTCGQFGFNHKHAPSEFIYIKDFNPVAAK